MILDEDITQNLRKNWNSRMTRTYKEGLNGVVEKINNEKNKLDVDFSKHLKTWGEIMPQPKAWISEKNEEVQNSTSK